MQQLTVKKLLELCKQAVKNGLGDKKIVISDDNEGNGYHGMFYGFTILTEDNQDYYPIYDSNAAIDETIILG